jgi:hypothetical protein
MRMGKKRLTEKAYTNGTLEQVERGRERENENGHSPCSCSRESERKNGSCFRFGEEDE